MDQFTSRKFVLGFVVVVIGLIFLVKLFVLQVVNTDYESIAQSNSTKVIVEYPARGLIFDRNQKLMVYNQPAYDFMYDPKLSRESFDTTELTAILDISKSEFLERFNEIKYQPGVILKQISSETYARIQEVLFKYPGFFVQKRTLRKYQKKIASHVLGYVGEDQDIIKNDPYYRLGDYVGINGVEKAYEEYLRGVKGKKIFVVDALGKIKGPYENGKQDVEARVGDSITITIDMDLQEYGEKLMQNKIGSIVAIEPSTGEVLAMVSSPTYNPELLVGRNRSKNYIRLQQDTLDPLFNRPIMARYRPGSTFKLINGAIALHEGILNEHTLYRSAGAYRAGRVVVGCHNYRSPLNIKQAIQYSSNNFFCQVFRNTVDHPKFDNFYEAYDIWREHIMSFGFGQRLGIELPNETPGLVPSLEYYNRLYGKNGWKSLTIISLAIGEGEFGITPLQLANEAVIFANRGYYYQPHVIKKVGSKNMIDKFSEKHYTSLDTSVFETIVDGMELVVNGGPGSTAGWITLKDKDIVVCGKTGTAQSLEKEDHSVFIAFAPRENPQIAISVYIEHAGAGGTWAAPVARLMIEKYLTGQVKSGWFEQRILDANLLNVEKKD